MQETTQINEIPEVSDQKPIEAKPKKLMDKKAIYLATGALVFVCLTIILAIFLLPKLINWEKDADVDTNPSISPTASVPQEITVSPTFDENPYETDGNPINVYKYIGNQISPSDLVKYEGGPVDCQPLSFDPSKDKYTLENVEGTPSKLYKIEGFDDGMMMINGWLSEGSEKINIDNTYSVNFYQFGCASSTSYTLDILKNKTRQRYFTQVENFEFSEDGKFAYIMFNSLNDRKINRVIYDVVNNTIKDIPTLPCNSFDAFWQQDRLLTYHKNFDSSEYTTDLCIWDKSANLIARSNLTTYWSSASRDILSEKIGLLPENKNILYFYTSSSSDYNNKCTLYTVDLENTPSKVKSALILGKGEFKCVEPEVQFDFIGMKSAIGTFSFRYNKAGSDSDTKSWSEWNVVTTK